MSLIRPRRTLLSVSDKAGLLELGRALAAAGSELVATGKTAQILKDGGLSVRLVEEISGSPEAFAGRMKTLTFGICSGILFRRGDADDERDVKKLGILPIDCVVVNFYPFEKTAAQPGISREALIEQIDIGGPTLVRAAAKNAAFVTVLTDPAQYGAVIQELGEQGGFSQPTRERLAAECWDRVHAYDLAVAEKLGAGGFALRYGENPHQSGRLEVEGHPPILWPVKDADRLTAQELSYNNILDVSAAYAIASDLLRLGGKGSGAVIVKHNNPCGVAWVPRELGTADGGQKLALLKAWEGDPVSAFGGVVVLTEPLELETAQWLAERFVELVAAPELGGAPLRALLEKRKNLKALRIDRFGEEPTQSLVRVPGGRLYQQTDVGGLELETLNSVTKKAFPAEKTELARFGIAVTRALKSNAIALVRELPEVAGAYQLVGAGQGQPNRVDALKGLALPRAQAVLAQVGGRIGDTLLVSDAFFPFRDSVDAAYAGGVRWIVQPGGSRKDDESVAACDEHGVAMAFTGRRHFKH